MIEEMLAYNREFVRSKGYEKFQTSKYPDKKIAILTCMDTRLVELLPAALGIRNGDVKLIKNAGGMITGPFDSAVRSLLVGIVELGVEEVMVIGNTDCGVAQVNKQVEMPCGENGMASSLSGVFHTPFLTVSSMDVRAV